MLFSGNSWGIDWQKAVDFANLREEKGDHLMSIQPFGGGLNTAGIVVIYRSKK